MRQFIYVVHDSMELFNSYTTKYAYGTAGVKP